MRSLPLTASAQTCGIVSKIAWYEMPPPPLPKDLEPRAAQGSSGKRDGWSSHFANLNETNAARLRCHVMAGHGLKQNLRRMSPEKIEYHVEMVAVGFSLERCRQFSIRFVEGNGRVRPKIWQRLQHFWVAPDSYYTSCAEVPRNLHGESARDTGCAQNENCLARLEVRPPDQRESGR